ncbi:MAG: class I SAM-dependent methyltransferase [Candidatus Auribacter fodinae]|jgi:SAM-dependent methyltransferase|uniref:Class I SAM-dependent methyltransferase n=1 Tax=Candidatus Auribacter fodinae TaxID=2093366 RepID=A0A3A4R6N1_9BACT|nr:MAG: class I SAM-dependent methyltransferase [Candidatus Auribacter fodinae]
MKFELLQRFDKKRSPEQLRKHFDTEKAIAAKLKTSSREERKVIYSTMYDELLATVPDHPRLTRRKDRVTTETRIRTQLALIERFLADDTIFVEFAPGDCELALHMCSRVKSVYAIDISDQGRESLVDAPKNFKLIIYNGYDLDFEENIADVVFSDQLIEHLHPDDTQLHFQLVYKILKEGGAYVFRTPHKFMGPCDISRYFSDKAEGFHLKEWTFMELAKVIKSVGFRSWFIYWKNNLIYEQPIFYLSIVEMVLKMFPRESRKIATTVFLPGDISMVCIK